MADGPTGLFDYSDLPMRDVIDLKDWSDLPGEKVYDYLHACAARFHLIERLRLSTTISHISRNIDGKAWDVRIADSEEIVTCDKLILATGLYSKPYWPDVPREDFHGFVMHSKEMGIHHRELTSEKVNRITVYGGCKSSVDAIIFCLQAGKKVDWVIRETGNSPGLMAEVRKHGVHGAILVDRWKNILTPSIFSTTGFWYNFLHSGKSRMGYWICRSLWAKASTAIFTMEPYKTKSPNMEKLMPETPE
jgi:cation diffusion facilitator CzcD-associated flavoprotein CzcO